MKRSPIKPGAKSLARRSTFASHGEGLKRKGSLATKRRAAINRQASEAWARGVKSKPCALCGAQGVQGHHVITQQELRKAALRLGRDFESLRWDHRNRLPLCPRHHAAHHARTHPVPWAVLERCCPKVFGFARELDLGWWLERTYPAEQMARAA